MRIAILVMFISVLMGCGIVSNSNISNNMNDARVVVEPPYQPNNAIFNDGNFYIYNETTPIVWQGQVFFVSTKYEGSGMNAALVLYNRTTKQEIMLSRWNYRFVSAIVVNDVIHVYCTGFYDYAIYHFTIDPSYNVTPITCIIANPGNQNFYNTSICTDATGYTMAIETDYSYWTKFSEIFFHSTDLINWTVTTNARHGVNRYTACPTIRYFGGYYYMTYLAIQPSPYYYFTRIDRSTDLINWTSAYKTVLYPQNITGNNTSDLDFVDLGNGTTLATWMDGDQIHPMQIPLKEGIINSTLQTFCESFF